MFFCLRHSAVGTLHHRDKRFFYVFEILLTSVYVFDVCFL